MQEGLLAILRDEFRASTEPLVQVEDPISGVVTQIQLRQLVEFSQQGVEIETREQVVVEIQFQESRREGRDKLVG